MNREELMMVMSGYKNEYPEWVKEWIEEETLQQNSIEIRQMKDGWFRTVKVYEDDSVKMEAKVNAYQEIAQKAVDRETDSE